MAVFKLIAIFEQVTNLSGDSIGHRIAGWSEGVYGVSGNFPLLRTQFEALCEARAPLLGTGSSIVGQRYELIDPIGRTQTGARRFTPSFEKSDVPQMALTFVVNALNTPHVRRFTLRGLRDGLAEEGEYKPTANSPAAISAFVRALSPFSMRASNLQTPYVPLLGVDAVGNFTMAQPLTYAVGDRVTVKGAKTSLGTVPTQAYYVEARTDATHGKLGNWVAGVAIEGAVRGQLVSYPTFDPNTPIAPQITVRKAGRPLGGYRGRASKRA